MDFGDVIAAVAIVAVFAFLFWYFYQMWVRSQRLLKRWVKENGFTLLGSQLRLFRKGPYFWSSRGQVVYRVELLDELGIKRQGWVRCGGFWAGVFSDVVEGKLDD